jgi:transposase InsO family protein
MPWKASSVQDERIRFVIEASRQERPLAAVCRDFGISRPTGYTWLSRYRKAGRVNDIRELSRRPHRIVRQTGEAVIDRVVSLRLAHGWGARKLQVLLVREGITLSESTINRILKRQGLQYEPEVSGQAIRRFVREAPNDLWQMDFKGPYRTAAGRCCPLSILDDHSRYLVGLYALGDQLGQSVHQSLVRTFERYGVPEAMLVDHGIPWFSPNGHGLTWLAVALIKQGIRLCFSGIRHPQTQGKVERFHRTLSDSVRHHGRPEHLAGWQRAFDDFAIEYNHIRPHEELAMAVPASQYQSSPRSYQHEPPEWEYSAGATVKRLNAKGLLQWRRHYYFVCEALAGERVEINRCEDKLLVRYRHMWIREIDTKTARSETLIDKTVNPYL